MTRTVVAVVEGDGEVQALPLLLRRMAEWRNVGVDAEVVRPIRVRRDRFLRRDDEFRRMLSLAEAKAGADGGVLVLLDADDDCPASLGPELLARVQGALPRARCSVVLANREYEAWFIAAAASLDGVRGFRCPARIVADPDVPRDAKGWMRDHMGQDRYSPVSDQAAFSSRLDLAVAFRASRSFRKLVSAWEHLCA